MVVSVVDLRVCFSVLFSSFFVSFLCMCESRLCERVVLCFCVYWIVVVLGQSRFWLFGREGVSSETSLWLGAVNRGSWCNISGTGSGGLKCDWLEFFLFVFEK